MAKTPVSTLVLDKMKPEAADKVKNDPNTILYTPDPFVQKFDYQKQVFKDAKKDKDIQAKDFKKLWVLYKETLVPGLPDIVHEITKTQREQIQEVVKAWKAMSAQDKFLLPAASHWLAQIRSILGQTQEDMVTIFYEHGHYVPVSWIGGWERGAKNNDDMPHEYFRLPTSIAGSPDRMTVLARILHITLEDLLMLCGYPISGKNELPVDVQRLRKLELIQSYTEEFLSIENCNPQHLSAILTVLKTKTLEQAQSAIELLRDSVPQQLPSIIRFLSAA